MLRSLPAGVWIRSDLPEGGLTLHEFGDEAAVRIRLFHADKVGFADLWRAAEQQRRSTAVPWSPAREVWVLGRRTLRVSGEFRGTTHLHVLVDAGARLVHLALTDQASRTFDDMDELAQELVENLDLDDPVPAPPADDVPPASLLPWLLPSDHPARSLCTVLELANDLGVAVAGFTSPHARILGPLHPWWSDPGPAALLDLARLNLVRRAAENEFPTAVRSLHLAKALVIGPHPFAASCLLLPDLYLWAHAVLGLTDLIAHVVRRDQLVITTPDVSVDVRCWAPPLNLHP